MASKDDTSKDLKPSQMKKNSTRLEKIIFLIDESMNPFSDKVSLDALYNIGSGKAASKETSDFLLNIKVIGSNAQEKFIQECIEDPIRFDHKCIKRQNVRTFAMEGEKYLMPGKEKLVEVKMERDLFGSILFIALQRKIDMGVVLRYPLTPTPLSLCHVDGAMHKTSEPLLMKELEKRAMTSYPELIDNVIVDGMFFLHTLPELPSIYGAVSKFILKRLCRFDTPRIDMVFDKIASPSIKDCERDNRAVGNNRHVTYVITGPAQKRPNIFIGALRNDQFKVSSWEDNSNAHILNEKELYSTRDERCYSFKVIDGVMIKKEEISLTSSHEEADSRMVFHCKLLQGSKNIVIRTNDTDVLIIFLGNMPKLDPGLHIWLAVGLQAQNKLRYIDVNKIFETLGTNLCAALPGCHAYTGYDYTASFSRKGKVRPLAFLEKNQNAIEMFSKLGDEEDIKR